MDDLGRQSDRPGKGEMFRAITRVSGSVLGIVGDIGELNEDTQRGAAGPAHGAGRVHLALHPGLPLVAGSSGAGWATWVDGKGDGEGDDLRVDRQRISVIGMMRRHAEALTQAGQAEQATLWRDEADRMERSADEVPFPGGGLPPEWAAAFAARGDELRAAWCEPMAEFELGQVRKSGLSVHTE